MYHHRLGLLKGYDPLNTEQFLTSDTGGSVSYLGDQGSLPDPLVKCLNDADNTYFCIFSSYILFFLNSLCTTFKHLKLFLSAYIDSYPQSPLQEAALGVFNKAALVRRCFGADF